MPPVALPTSPESAILLTRSTSPIILAHVCNSWRAAAFSSALLWTSIYLEFRPGAHAQRQLNRLRAHLSYSGTSPLSISLSFLLAEQPNYLDSTCARDALDVILSAAARWRSLSILAPSHLLIDFSERSNRSAPVTLQLETLSLAAPVLQARPTPFPLGLHAPGLRTLTIEGIDTHVRGVHWEVLHDLTLIRSWALRAKFWETVDALKLCRELRQCTLSVDHVSQENDALRPSKQPVIRWPHLHMLELRANLNDFGIVTLLPLLELRKLKTLHLHSMGMTTQTCFDTIFAFLERWGGMLSNLLIAPCDCDEDMILRFLRVLPNLSHISIVSRTPFQPLGHDIMTGLKNGLCPRLEVVTFYGQADVTFLEVIDLVNARTASGAPLKKVHFSLSHHIPSHDVALLRNWIAEKKDADGITIEMEVCDVDLKVYETPDWRQGGMEAPPIYDG
jgi:hypothetical protein